MAVEKVPVEKVEKERPETIKEIVEAAREKGRERRERLMERLDPCFAPDVLVGEGKKLLGRAIEQKKEETKERAKNLIERTKGRVFETRERWERRVKEAFERLRERGEEIKDKTKERARDLGEGAARLGVLKLAKAEEIIGKGVFGSLASLEEWRRKRAQAKVERLLEALADAEEKEEILRERVEEARKKADTFGLIRRSIENLPTL